MDGLIVRFQCYLNVVETRITEVLEERIAGIEGIRFVDSKSEDGRFWVPPVLGGDA